MSTETSKWIDLLKVKYTQTEDGTFVGFGFISESSSEMIMRCTGVDIHAATQDESYTQYKTVSNFIPAGSASSETHSSTGVKWTFNDMGGN